MTTTADEAHPPGNRIMRGALLGLAVGTLDALLGGGNRTLRLVVEGAAAGALYAAGEQLLGLPPLEHQVGALLSAGSGPSQPQRDHQAARAHSTAARRRAAAQPRRRRRAALRRRREGASQRLQQASSALALSVFADSAIEHYRGGFYNPAMYIAPVVSGLTLATALSGAARPEGSGNARALVFAAAAATGLIGTGFHTYNILKREGGLNWLNLFYAAPLAAPMGITFAGLFGLASRGIRRRGTSRPVRLLGRPAGQTIALAAAAGLLGTAAEAGLLHFRGAFHDPFMYIPVTVPPLAALALGRAALRSDGSGRGVARFLLRTTAAAGFAGMGFHAYGIHRNMGGWSNWTQMIQQGPPLPAPPSFTGMALAGLAALELMPGGVHA